MAFLIAVVHVLSLLWQLKISIDLYMKVKIDLYCNATAYILTEMFLEMSSTKCVIFVQCFEFDWLTWIGWHGNWMLSLPKQYNIQKSSP